MDKPSFINFIRSDMSQWLIHCTTSFGTLKKILTEKCLRGSNKNILGNYYCVCFSEAPLSKLNALIHFSENFGSQIGTKIRYAPFGIAIRKEWLFERGGRPAIYQAESEFKLLSDHHRHLHVSYDPLGGEDTTWEREWRIETRKLILDEKNVTVFVSTRKHVERLVADFDEMLADAEQKAEGYAQGWHFISLEELT